MSMKSNNLASKLPQQLHVALGDNQLLPLFGVKGDFMPVNEDFEPFDTL